MIFFVVAMIMTYYLVIVIMIRSMEKMALIS